MSNDVTVYLIEKRRRFEDRERLTWLLRWSGTDGRMRQKSIGEVKPRRVKIANMPDGMLTRSMAEKIRADHEAELRKAESTVVIDGVPKLTVGDFREWVPRHMKRASEGRRRNVSTSLRRFAEFLGGFQTEPASGDKRTVDERLAIAEKNGDRKSLVASAKPRTAMGFESWLFDLNAGRGGETLSEATVRAHLANVKAAFRIACKAELVVRNPFEDIETTAPEPDKDWAELTGDDVARLIDAAMSPAWRALIALCAYAGVRRGEALRLTWADVKWDLNRIVVRNPGRKRTTKHRTREVLMTPELEAVLLDVYEVAEGDRVADVPSNNLHRNMRRTIERAGIDLPTDPFQTLRRWRDTVWQAEVGPMYAALWLGHDPKVAQRNYVRVPETAYQRDAGDAAAVEAAA